MGGRIMHGLGVCRLDLRAWRGLVTGEGIAHSGGQLTRGVKLKLQMAMRARPG